MGAARRRSAGRRTAGRCGALIALIVLVPSASLVPSTARAAVSGRSAERGAPIRPADPRARGLVYDGLFPALPGSPCGAVGFEVLQSGGALSCSHGPDPAPEGIDVRSPRPLADLRAQAATVAPASVPCLGNGKSGKRVQAIYAVASDQTDRYESVAPLIRTWAAFEVGDVVAASAWETEGARAVRFVTDSSCQLVVDHVILSPGGDDDFGAMIGELQAKGYTASNRKFLVWADAAVYCGIAQALGDDRPDQGNLNNGHNGIAGMVSRVDSGCWGLGATSTPVEAHELEHTLGAVQNSAPHSSSRFPQSPGFHCTDDRDTMCYADGPGVVIDIVCPDLFHEHRLDCGHDDYFSTAPAPGSYLATHWNTASSAFLEPVQPPVVTGVSPSGGVVGATVAIDGVGFIGATGVVFGGVEQPTFTVVSDTRITARVPGGAVTGSVGVTTPLGTGYRLPAFKVRPKVTSFSPGAGPPGTGVTISGSAFTGAVSVRFGSVAASFSVVSYTTISATVPAGATTGPITVITFGGTGASRASFVVT